MAFFHKGIKMELKDKLKEKGLNLAESYMLKMVDDVLEIGEMLVADTENQFDDMALAALKMFKGELVKLIDKVDGEEG